MKLIGLIRVSTEEQAKDGRAGIARQQHEIEQIANREQAELIKVVTLIDVSGSDVGETPEWQDQVVPRLRAGAHLVVDEISRVARPDKFDFSLVASLQETGVKVYTPSGPTDLSTPEGYMKAAMGAVFGGMEKLTLKRRVWEGRERIREAGGHPGSDITLPLACAYDRDSKQWVYTEDKWKVQRAFELWVSEGCSMAQIAREIGLTSGGVRVVLENPIYKGWRVYDKKCGFETYKKVNGRQPRRKKVRRSDDEVIKVQVYGGKGQEPALVDAKVWKAAQDQLRASKVTVARRRARSQPKIYYTGYLVSCEGDHIPGSPEMEEHRLYGRTQKAAENQDYYICRCNDPGGPDEKCKLRGLPTGLTNQALDALMARISRDKSWLKDMIKELVQGQDDTEKQIRKLKGKILEAKGQMDTLVDLLMDGRIDRANYDKRYDRLRDAVASHQEELATLEAGDNGPSPDELRDSVKGLLFDPKWSPEKKREWLSAHIEAIHVCNEGPHGVTLRVYGYTIIQWNKWEDLLGHGLWDRRARLRARRQAQGVFHAQDVAARLGLSRSRLRYLIRSGQVPMPAGRIGKSTKRFWTTEDLAATVEAYQALKAS